MTSSEYLYEGKTIEGRPLRLFCRDGANDQDVAHSVTVCDEYGLRGLDLSGWALDVGAYIGAVAISLAIDHPALHVVAVEPVAENVENLRRNVAINGMQERVHVEPLAAVGEDGPPLLTIRSGFGGRHEFVGNLHDGRHATARDVATLTIRDVLRLYEIDELALMKLDCEGCELPVLADPDVRRVRRIVGEYHVQPRRLFGPLARTHAVTANEASYHFTAVAK